MKQTIYLFSGEGTRSSDTHISVIRTSPVWNQAATVLQERLNLDLTALWEQAAGSHHGPYSPLLTAVSQICLADHWRRWGYAPDVVIGHSTGELAAAHAAGLYSLEEILVLAHQIGSVAAHLDGAMLHGRLSDADVRRLGVNLSSINFTDGAGRHVTVCGYTGPMDAFQRQHPEFVRMKLPHPWHHPDYARYVDQLTPPESARIGQGIFISGLTTAFETHLGRDHWRAWLTTPIDFIRTMQTLRARHGGAHLDFIEIGPHPVLAKCLEIFTDYTHVSSMFRGEDEVAWIMHQRRKLDPSPFLAQVGQCIDEVRPGLDVDESLAYQGFDSLAFMALADRLGPYFPTLEPQDFYRFKTINQLIDRFGVEVAATTTTPPRESRNGVVIAGMSCRLPAAVETPQQFWDMLVGQADQVRAETGRGGAEAGFLDAATTRFDHQFFRIAAAEARTMDPQQILALELTEMLWRDAGIDPQTLDRSRVGVYIGAWSQEYRGDRTSVYYPTGTNPSIIAARISYHYDLRGPSWVSNTACSSSLLAVHYAAKDIEAGRVDYAIAGGVNMLVDEEFTASMRDAGFLSPDHRCKTFDNTANGYVRAEGGGLVLLVNRTLASTYYAELAGSAVNQNGGRAQTLTAPHPEAQEELIVAACQDAAIQPRDIAYVECHGTGTKLGDPIEMSAIQRTVAKNRRDTCYVGSVKSTIGHLESAAGIAGLIKAVAVLNQGWIPPHLHFNDPNAHIDFQSHPVRVVTVMTPIDPEAHAGISSFGFGGSNAHIIVKGAGASVRKPIRPLEIPFDRRRGAALNAYLHLLTPASAADTGATAPPQADFQEQAVTRDNVADMVDRLFFELTGINGIDPEIELTEQGLDSMSAAELVSKLESALKIELEPEFIFEYPLKDAFIDAVSAIAGRLN